MSKDIIGSDVLPKSLNNEEYKEYIESFRSLGLQDVLIQAYKKNTRGDNYELQLPQSEKDRNILLKIYTSVEKEKWIKAATVYIVANWIYTHRIRFGRIGNQDDDYRKAEYLPCSCINSVSNFHFSI